MFVKTILSGFQTASKEGKCPSNKLFLQYIKTYKKTGIKMREAVLVCPEGKTMARDGQQTLTASDISVSREGERVITRATTSTKLAYSPSNLLDYIMVKRNGISWLLLFSSHKKYPNKEEED